MRAWAKARGNPWFILSAKHGLLHPDTTVEPYNDRGVSEELAHDVADLIAEKDVSVVDITAGKDYTNHLVPELERRGIDVINHFAGCKIGERERKLVQATERIINDGQ
jgi:predicted ThiF/HesA family dinucleotide-utilizing enzyme